MRTPLAFTPESRESDTVAGIEIYYTIGIALEQQQGALDLGPKATTQEKLLLTSQFINPDALV